MLTGDGLLSGPRWEGGQAALGRGLIQFQLQLMCFEKA